MQLSSLSLTLFLTLALATFAAGQVTEAEVAIHADEDDCWSIVNDKVYDLTEFAPTHHGKDVIYLMCGIEGTALYNSEHGGKGSDYIDLFAEFVGDLAVAGVPATAAVVPPATQVTVVTTTQAPAVPQVEPPAMTEPSTTVTEPSPPGSTDPMTATVTVVTVIQTNSTTNATLTTSGTAAANPDMEADEDIMNINMAASAVNCGQGTGTSGKSMVRGIRGRDNKDDNSVGGGKQGDVAAVAGCEDDNGGDDKNDKIDVEEEDDNAKDDKNDKQNRNFLD